MIRSLTKMKWRDEDLFQSMAEVLGFGMGHGERIAMDRWVFFGP